MNSIRKFFKFDENKTNFKTEILAGLTTFMTMAYALGTVPNIMGGAGLDRGVILTSMIILTIGTTVAMAIFTNRPFVLAPGLGSVGIVAGMIANDGISPQHTSGIIFWSSIILVIISLIGLRDVVMKSIPPSLKFSISAGIGLFLALLGARNAGLIVGIEGRNALGLGNLSSPAVVLSLIGLVLILATKMLKVPGYLIISILVTTLIGIPMGVTQIPETFIMMPTSPAQQFMRIDILGALKVAYIPFILALFIPDFFSTFGTLIGLGGKAGYLDKDGNLPGMEKCFRIDAISSVAGGFFGIPCVNTYLESSAGIEAGGRTGVTSIVSCICFALTLLLTPFALMIPAAATAPALIIIGIEMLGAIKNVDFSDYTEYFPAFVCIAFTVYANNIANGICFALPIYLILKVAAGRIKEVPPAMYALVGVSLFYFYTLL